MKNLFLPFIILLSFATIFSCANDDDDTMIVETTVEDDKANVQQSFDDLVSCVQEVKDSRSFTELFTNFLNMSDGEVMNEAWVNSLTEELESVFDFDHVETNSAFVMAHHAGSHIYNASTSTWSKINDVSDRIVLRFPSQPNQMNNNVEFVLDDFSDKVVEIDGESMSLPTSMHAYINVDQSKIFELTLSKITYADNSGFQIPVEIDASLFMEPVTLDFDVSRLSTTSYEMGFSLTNDGICDMSIQSQVELEDDDFENLDMNSIDRAAVQVNLGKLSFRTMGDLASLLAIEEPTDDQINSMSDVDLFFNDLKIADIEINDDMETILLRI